MNLPAISFSLQHERVASPAPPAASDRFASVSSGLYRFVVVRLGGNSVLADDIMQQVWLEANRGPAGSVDDWESWLRGVARNLIRQLSASYGCGSAGSAG